MKLDPCKFCGGSAGAPRDEQTEFNSWMASIDCTECEITLTMQYGCDSPQRAVESISEMWNSKPVATP